MASLKEIKGSAGRRFQTISDFAEITTDKPEKSLLEPLPKKAGRNNNGRITTRHQGGGHKRRYRGVLVELISLRGVQFQCYSPDSFGD